MKSAIPAWKSLGESTAAAQQHNTVADKELEQPRRLAAPQRPSKPVHTALAPQAQSLGTSATVSASPAVGKVFYRSISTGLNYVCSASAITSAGETMVLTAAHCLHGGDPGTFHIKWVFVPYYYEGQAPYGMWESFDKVVPRQWGEDNDYDYDFGIALVEYKDGMQRSIIDTVGGNGLTVGGSFSKYYTVLGYPSLGRFDGQHQYYCQGQSHVSNVFFDPNRIEISCDMNGGASGGPWLLNYSNMYGYANGLTSTGDDKVDTTEIQSPYFYNETVGRMYRTFANVTPPCPDCA